MGVGSILFLTFATPRACDIGRERPWINKKTKTKTFRENLYVWGKKKKKKNGSERTAGRPCVPMVSLQKTRWMRRVRWLHGQLNCAYKGVELGIMICSFIASMRKLSKREGNKLKREGDHTRERGERTRCGANMARWKTRKDVMDSTTERVSLTLQ